jgi:MtN3 and saliva related transmembrane protein
MNFVTIIGLIAACLTTFAFLPQALKIVKTKHTTDISLVMYLILFTGVCFWLAYGILINSIPVIFANTITFVLVMMIIILKIKYK